MKKKIVGVFLISLMCLLAGCGNKEAKNENTVRIDSLEINPEELEYVEETDAQSFMSGNMITKGEEGYYYWDSELLMYYDSAMEKSIPLCNKSSCNHQDENCNATFQNTKYDIKKTFLQYYDGNIYVLGMDEDFNISLFRVAADGSSWEPYMKLFRIDAKVEEDTDAGVLNVSYRMPNVMIHRGYVYYVDINEAIPKLRRTKMGSDQAELLFEVANDKSKITNMNAFGNYLFFNMSDYSEGYDGTLYAYDVRTNTLMEGVEGVAGPIFVTKAGIYMSTDKNIDFYDFDTKEISTLIADAGSFAKVNVDDKNIYLFDWSEHKLKVYDLKGEQITEVCDEHLSTTCYFGEDDFFFAPNEKWEILVMKVKDLLQGNGKWEAIEAWNE